MPAFHSLLAQADSLADTLASLRDSPYAPWIGGALLLFIAFALLKAAAQLVIKGTGAILLLALGFLAWNWWNEEPDRSLKDIRTEWTEVIQQTDFSKESFQGLMSRSGNLLNEALATSQTKGRESAKEALTSVSEALDGKIREAASKGQVEAKERFEQLRAEVRRHLAELNQSSDS